MKTNENKANIENKHEQTSTLTNIQTSTNNSPSQTQQIIHKHQQNKINKTNINKIKSTINKTKLTNKINKLNKTKEKQKEDRKQQRITQFFKNRSTTLPPQDTSSLDQGATLNSVESTLLLTDSSDIFD